MAIDAYIPTGPLRDYVLRIHYLSGDGIGTGVALQRMHQVIILNMGTDFGATDIHSGRPRQDAHTGPVWVNGKQEIPFMLENHGVTAMYAITLRAGMLPFFAGMPAVETNELAVGAEHWKRRGFFELHDRLLGEPDVREAFKMIEAYMLRELGRADISEAKRTHWLGEALTHKRVETTAAARCPPSTTTTTSRTSSTTSRPGCRSRRSSTGGCASVFHRSVTRRIL